MNSFLGQSVGQGAGLKADTIFRVTSQLLNNVTCFLPHCSKGASNLPLVLTMAACGKVHCLRVSLFPTVHDSWLIFHTLVNLEGLFTSLKLIPLVIPLFSPKFVLALAFLVLLLRCKKGLTPSILMLYIDF